MRMLVPALGRHVGYGAFQDFEQGLLDASPETSRVMETLSDRLAILSISSM